jgi:hypothetical protein
MHQIQCVPVDKRTMQVLGCFPTDALLFLGLELHFAQVLSRMPLSMLGLGRLMGPNPLLRGRSTVDFQ